jgi:TRAP-type C4-dicarboxylate transport system substrate-binding protein
VQLKFYLGGVAGDEMAVLERIKRGQIDGSAGALNCEKLSPSLRVARIPGLFRAREEFRHVLGKLRKRLDKEFAHSGFLAIGLGSFGSVMLFSREPVRTMEELRHGHYWIWELDEVYQKLLPEMGIHTVPLPVDQAGRAYADGRHDGFFSVPGGALAFQWSAQTRYFSDLHFSTLPGCLILAQRAVDPLPLAWQQAIRDAGARMESRFEEIGRLEDEALETRLFEKQGVTRVPASEGFRAQFFEAARQARDRVGTKIIAPELIAQVLEWLADFRAEKGDRDRRP